VLAGSQLNKRKVPGLRLFCLTQGANSVHVSVSLPSPSVFFRPSPKNIPLNFPRLTAGNTTQGRSLKALPKPRQFYYGHS